MNPFSPEYMQIQVDTFVGYGLSGIAVPDTDLPRQQEILQGINDFSWQLLYADSLGHIQSAGSSRFRTFNLLAAILEDPSPEAQHRLIAAMTIC